MHIPVSLSHPGSKTTVGTRALIDCGAGGKFIDSRFVKKHNLPTTRLSKPIPVFNVDGTPNKKGTIREYSSLTVKMGNRIN